MWSTCYVVLRGPQLHRSATTTPSSHHILPWLLLFTIEILKTSATKIYAHTVYTNLTHIFVENLLLPLLHIWNVHIILLTQLCCRTGTIKLFFNRFLNFTLNIWVYSTLNTYVLSLGKWNQVFWPPLSIQSYSPLSP